MPSITDIPGISVGHAQNKEGATGCTVILAGENGAVGGVDVRGGAPGSRELALLSPERLVDRVHGLFLSGGSAFGLDAAGGAMELLREKGIGFPTGILPVPILPAAVIFDFLIGDPIWPDAEMAYHAAKSAHTGEVEMGSVGVGCGATIGKILGPKTTMKSGLGSSSCVLPNGIKVGALVVVNAFGDILDPKDGSFVGGLYDQEKRAFLDTVKVMEDSQKKRDFTLQNTTLGVVATDASLTKAEATKLAQMGQIGLAKTLWPAHTMFDGDTVFSLATGASKEEMDLSLLGVTAARMMVDAVLFAVKEATSLAGITALKDIQL